LSCKIGGAREITLYPNRSEAKWRDLVFSSRPAAEMILVQAQADL